MLPLLILLATLDVSALKVGAAATIAELDLGTLKGELRQIGWSPDGLQLYVQTVEGDGASAKTRHYVVAAAGGAPAPVASQPAWAAEYWSVKSDRSAPGNAALMIDVTQKLETIKAGTGYAGGLDRESTNPGLAAANPSVESLGKANDQNQRANVVRLVLFGEAVSEFVNARPIPGLMFGWGPKGSGAVAFTDRDGRLFLLDEHHKKAVDAAKAAVLPAWTTDGAKLAWAQKTGRRKYALMVAAVGQ